MMGVLVREGEKAGLKNGGTAGAPGVLDAGGKNHPV